MIVSLAGTYMADHLDVWDESEFGPAPTGTLSGNGRLWRGDLTIDQAREVFDRASLYAHDDDYRDLCPNIRRSAKAVFKALEMRFGIDFLDPAGQIRGRDDFRK